ncbi:MAG: PAS domain S-box protein [Nanoarchaeota archaeon]
MKKKEEAEHISAYPKENPNPIIRLDYRGNAIYANSAGEKFLKWERGIRAPNTLWQRVLIALKNNIKSVVYFGYDHASYSFQILPKPKMKYVTLYGMDITELKKAQEEIAKSESLFKSLYEASMTMQGTTGEILEAICKKVREIFGGFFVLVNHAEGGEFHFRAGCSLPKEVVALGKEPMKGTICSHILETKKPMFTNNLQKGKCPQCLLRFSEDKAVKSLKLNTYFGAPLVYSDNSVRGTLCIVYREKRSPFSERDNEILSLFAKRAAIVLETEELQKEIQEKENKYRALFENAADAIFIADPATRQLIDCNKAAERLTGYSREKILSMKADNLHPKDKAKETMEGFKRQAEGREKVVFSEVMTKDKKRVPVEISAGSFRIGDKEYMEGIFRDITWKRKTEKEQKEYLKHLETFKEFAVNRELKMIELKEKIKKLEGKKGAQEIEAARK